MLQHKRLALALGAPAWLVLERQAAVVRPDPIIESGTHRDGSAVRKVR
ncbi:MAG TPA: hypothetical protein PLK67_01060 [Bryobacteraceae bacterium]|nr:hypothetical protein [Bryobacteraceae bacterium]HOQ46223.1 hypothetical protein [Bryobacteraceae bacterium]